MRTITEENKLEIAAGFSKIAGEFGIGIETCAEDIDLSGFGIGHGKCIDAKLIEELTDCKLDVRKDKNQRRECGCAESIDIGMYNTCPSGCKYCYANYSSRAARRNFKSHDPYSDLLCGAVTNRDRIIDRSAKSLKASCR